MYEFITMRRAAALALCLGLCGVASADTNCDVHAAAMVAEMRASAAKPMSDAEIALVRETARKSCVAQGGGAAPASVAPASAVASAPPQPAAPAAKAAKSDDSFWGALGGFIGGSTDRKPGNVRLLERSGH